MDLRENVLFMAYDGDDLGQGRYFEAFTDSLAAAVFYYAERMDDKARGVVIRTKHDSTDNSTVTVFSYDYLCLESIGDPRRRRPDRSLRSLRPSLGRVPAAKLL